MKKETVKKFFEFLEKKENRFFPLPIYSTILEMPKEVYIPGELFVFEETDQKFPEKLTVQSRFTLFGDPVHPLPQVIVCPRVNFINLSQDPGFPKIEKAIYIAFDDCKIPRLPDNLQALDWISVEGSDLTVIPKNMKCGMFFCKNTPLAQKFSAEEIKHMIEKEGGKVRKVNITGL